MSPQERLSNDAFFTKLTELLATATNAHKSSIFLTQKPLNPTPFVDAVPSSLLIRATNGRTDSSRRIKVATIVEPSDLEPFFARYAEVCKANMGSLKKRDRKKRKDRLKAKKGAAPTTTAATTAQ